MPESDKLNLSMKAKSKQFEQLKDEVKEMKKHKAPHSRIEPLKVSAPLISFKDVHVDTAFKADRGPSKDEKTKSEAQSPSVFKAQDSMKVVNTRIARSRQTSIPTAQDSAGNGNETRFQNNSRKNMMRDLDLAKSRPVNNGKSLFRAFVEEQEGNKTVVSVNDNSLSSLIFAEIEMGAEQSADRYDRMIEKLSLKNTYVAILNNLLTNKRHFIKLMLGMNEGSATEMFSTLRNLYVEIIELLKGAQRLRGIFDAAPALSTSMSIEEVIQSIADYVCESLKCERATVFALDKQSGQLWSKIAIGNSTTINVAVGKGIAGYVAMTGKSLSIRDAYYDDRFDRTNDELTGFRTKTILAVPILNMDGEVEGVIQAINRKPDEEGNLQYFERSDLGLLEMVASLASLNIQNTIEFNQQLNTLASMRSVLKICVKLYPVKDEVEFCKQGAAVLSELFNSSQARIFLTDPENPDDLYCFDDKGIKKTFNLVSLIGQAVENRQVISVVGSARDPRFNGSSV